jgi:polysaccharide deacetylase family protein (PEP-CTERM system associated)
VNVFSVDVEDYYHTEAMSATVLRERWNLMPSRVQGNTYRLFELLTKHNVRGTFFFLGWVAERFPDLVRDAVQLGHEVACHSYWHRPVYHLSPGEFREDTLRAKAVIEDAAGVPVRGYRAPSFSLIEGTKWAFDILAELGFTFDSSVHPIRHDLYSNPDAPRVPYRIGNGAILELPIATIRIGGSNFPFGGGGYFRLLPYAYMRWGLCRFNTIDAQPAIIYLHPWELDPSQPRLAAGLKTRLRQYSGLASAERKLDSLLRNFQFAPISDVFHKQLNESGAVEASDVKEVAHSRG